MSANSTSHPKGLYFLYSTEMWERFNFYGMRAILSLFLVSALSFKQDEAAILYGGFLGLSYLTPMLGGYISDRYIGNRNSIIGGGFAMAIGQLLLFSSASTFKLDVPFATNLMWGGLVFLILGNGFFKPNISSMVGQLYKKGDSRLDAAFTIFYMGINTGAMLGMLICPWLGDVKVDGVRVIEAFKWGFLAAGAAMLIGTILFILLKGVFLKAPDGSEIGLAPTFSAIKSADEETEKAEFSTQSIVISSALFIGLIIGFHYLFVTEVANPIKDWIYPVIYSAGISLAFLIMRDKTLTKIERDRIWVMYFVAFFVIFFWAAYEQAGSSLTFIADQQTDLNFFGIQLPPSSVQNANSFFIIILAFPFSWLWMRLAKKGIEPNSPGKQAIGLLLLAIGYLIIAIKVKNLGTDKLGVIWLFIMYLFHTMGELSLSPIGLSLVSKLAPKRFSSLLMGVWFLANAAGYALSGTLGALLPPATAVVGQTVFPSFLGFEIKNLYDFFIVFVIMAGIASILLFGLANGPLKKMMHGIR
ncbi:peptide MFS transporter [Aquirufa antheringensis]|uniref:peptide MFS transporter n=1 Tax=Aquirufa antheringensis TaxID=2516559 RepID=UPI0022A8BB5C|nr:peptide MFS transporter [Aquirufa antheringensis]MCZ2476649.1 peptide MFS transporter [Aquirufa antheringensis]